MGDNASRAFILCHTLDLRGRLQPQDLRMALQQVVDRHDALRATFSRDGTWMRIAPFTVNVADLDLSGRGRDARLAALLENETRTPFDLINGPLIRTQLLKLSKQHHLLVLAVHPIVCDRLSIGIVLRDLGACYTTAHDGVAAKLDPVMRFSEFAERQRSQQRIDELAPTEQYWVRKFSDRPPALALPTDRPRPALQSFGSAEHITAIDNALSERLLTLGTSHGYTLFATLLAAYVAFLHRLTGQDDIVVGNPSAGRSIAGTGDLVGHCVNFHPLRFSIDGQQPFTELLAQVQGVVQEAEEHGNYTYGSLLARLKWPREAGRSPLIATQFNLEATITGLHFTKLEATLESSRRGMEVSISASARSRAMARSIYGASTTPGCSTPARFVAGWKTSRCCCGASRTRRSNVSRRFRC